MAHKSKRTREMATKVDKTKVYSLDEAVEILKDSPPVKFDQSVDVAIRLGVDPKKSDQSVRGTVSLPKGTGKSVTVLVFAKGDKVQEAEKAGAEYVGFDEFYDKVKGGWTDFDAVVVTPDLMREVGKLGKVLGPRSLMPTPKAGTVTQDVASAVERIKAGQVEFKMDKHGSINNGVGKLSFGLEDLRENVNAFIAAVIKAKPAAAKGQYVKTIYISSTMGPGLKLDNKEFVAA